MTDEKKVKTSAERWESLVDAVETPDEKEIDEELRASGVNPERLARDGNTLAARLMREAGILPPEATTAADPGPARAPDRAVLADAEVLPFPSRRRRPLWPYFGVAAAAAVLAILALRRPPPIPNGPGSLEVAAQLRREATKQCDEAQWRECVDTLDRARDLDVAGDGRPEVQELRGAAAKWLTPAPVPPVPSAVPPVEDKKGGARPGTGP